MGCIKLLNAFLIWMECIRYALRLYQELRTVPVFFNRF